MTFGERVRQPRNAKSMILRKLAAVGHTYLGRVKSARMTYGEYPSEPSIHKLATALDTDENELPVLAEKIPEKIKRRVLQWPRAFGRLDDQKLDAVLKALEEP